MNLHLELECAKKALGRAKAAHTVSLELHRSEWSKQVQGEAQALVDKLEQRVKELRLLVRLDHQEARAS